MRTDASRPSAGNLFDIRFVPDEQSFKDRTVRDEATSVPANYAPPVLRQDLNTTNVKLTWDEDDPNRRKILTRKMTADDIREDDFRAYLASGEKPHLRSARAGIIHLLSGAAS